MLTRQIRPSRIIKSTSVFMQRRESRPSSVRIYKENKENINGSGIDYLMQKTSNAKYTVHKEKAHLH